VSLARLFFVLILQLTTIYAAFGADTGAAKLQGIDLQGNSIDLSAGGKEITVLVFVRSDCPISSRYAPTLQKLAAEHAGKAKFWLVYPDKSETVAGIQRYLHDYNYAQFSAVRDPQHTLVKTAKAEITPEAAVFDKNSRLIYHGRIDNWYQSFGHARSEPTTHELDQAINSALAGKPAPVAETKAVGCYISDVQ
jgi:thiol-disulfide isomerase/thioredoxin